ncbi:MAG: serine/threonine-protein kinase [Candidatus Sumerlaeia bacterium]|nr:serine/threonine-protein kinase [Candidatus Sumerlaeia bacterium]
MAETPPDNARLANSHWTDDDPFLERLPVDPGATFNPLLTGFQTAEAETSHGAYSQPTQDLGPGIPGPERDPVGGGPIPKRLLGAGGFGEVWEAVDPGLGRMVAVKRIRSEVLARIIDKPLELTYQRGLFFREAMTTARLEHPNIVPVHQYLHDGAGNPLLAMKRVRGSLWEHAIAADARLLDPYDYLAKHLQVLIAVAQAVAFAHDNGVIHRDLKPAQVMIGDYGEVLLMDWGLAMVFDEDRFRLEEAEGLGLPMPFTRANATNPSGTTSFMAPEQTERSAARLGPWTDIFLLGGVLYYLLSGTPPHDAKDKRQAFFQAVVCTVQHPSLRVPPGRPIPEELAALALRCLAPDPADRPGSALEVAEALRDYLTGAGRRRESVRHCAEVEAELPGADDYRSLGELVSRLGNARALWPENPRIEPLRDSVLAEYSERALANGDLALAAAQAERIADNARRGGLESRAAAAAERVRRQHRQRRSALAAVVVLLALLAAGGGVFSLRQREAARRIAAANEDLRRQRDEGDELIQFILRDLGQRLAPSGRLDALRDVALRAREYYERLPGAGDSPEAVRNRAFALRQIGDVLLAESRLPEAESAFRAGLELLESMSEAEGPLGDPDAERVEIRLRLCRALSEGGRWDDFMAEAAALESELLARGAARPNDPRPRALLARAYLLRAGAYPARGTMQTALADAHAAEALASELVNRHRPAREFYNVAADSSEMVARLLRLGGDATGALPRNEAAREYWRQSVELAPDDMVALREFAYSTESLATALYERGEYARSLELHREVLALRERLSAREPANALWRRELGEAHNGVAFLHHWRGEFDEALAHYRAAEAIYAEQLAATPGNMATRARRATALNNIGSVLGFMGRDRSALPYFEEMRAELERLLAADPANAEWRRMRATNHAKMGIMLQSFGRFEEAEAELLEYASINSSILDADPGNNAARQTLLGARIHLGMLYREWERHEDAAAAFALAERTLKVLNSDADMQSPAALREEANTIGRTLRTLLDTGRGDDAAEALARIDEIHARLAEIAPGDLGDFLRETSIELSVLRAGMRGGDPRGRLGALLSRIAEQRAAAPEHRGLARAEAQAMDLGAHLARGAGDTAAASAYAQTALAAYRALARPEDPQSQLDLLRACRSAGLSEEAAAAADTLRSIGYDATRLARLLAESPEGR